MVEEPMFLRYIRKSLDILLLNMKGYISLQKNAARKFSIYKLVDSRDNLPHYVGQTDSFERRQQEYLLKKTHSVALDKWFGELELLGLNPVMEEIDTIKGTVVDVKKKEVFWIQKFISEGAPLLNKINAVKRTSQVSYLAADQRQTLKVLTALEGREISDLISDALELYFDQSPYKVVIPMILAVKEQQGDLINES
jgi:hypothetical protein